MLRMARIEDGIADEIQFRPKPFAMIAGLDDVRETARIRATALRAMAAAIGVPQVVQVPVAGVPVIPSPAEVKAAQSGRGGWTRDQLRQWGVRWPPPKGWRQELERQYLEQQRRKK